MGHKARGRGGAGAEADGGLDLEPERALLRAFAASRGLDPDEVVRAVERAAVKMSASVAEGFDGGMANLRRAIAMFQESGVLPVLLSGGKLSTHYRAPTRAEVAQFLRLAAAEYERNGELPSFHLGSESLQNFDEAGVDRKTLAAATGRSLSTLRVALVDARKRSKR